jgi:hypothetical protein
MFKLVRKTLASLSIINREVGRQMLNVKRWKVSKTKMVPYGHGGKVGFTSRIPSQEG